MAFHRDESIIALLGQRNHLLGVSNLVKTKLLSHLRAYLSRITINSLTTTDDKIHIRADMLNRSREGIARSESVSTSKCTVCQQIATISTAIHGLSNDLSSTSWSHGDDMDSSAWV